MAHIPHGFLAVFDHLGPDAGAHHAPLGTTGWAVALGLGCLALALFRLTTRRQRT